MSSGRGNPPLHDTVSDVDDVDSQYSFRFIHYDKDSRTRKLVSTHGPPNKLLDFSSSVVVPTVYPP